MCTRDDTSQKLFLGLDLSTQQAKAVVINDSLEIVCEENVKFDDELQDFGTTGGVHFDAQTQSATTPTLLWVRAIDLLLFKLKDAKKFDMSNIFSLSGAGQQHGSVYWNVGANGILNSLDSSMSIYDQMLEAFAVDDSPIWMDSSTTKYCNKLENNFGGAENLAKLTGSRAYERFTGNQIAKVANENTDAYDKTERISLVSSFGASIFLGHYAPIDASDASGMNLMNIKLKQWDAKCMDACAPNLESKLGKIVPSETVVGTISSYMVDRYGFSPDCAVIAFTGDNPSSVAGMRLCDGDVIVSLGTSDTLFLWLTEPTPSPDGHVFVNPIDKDAYMALLCYKNGSLLRERIRDECTKGSWEDFEKVLLSTAVGNQGNIGFYFDVAEITPSNVCGVYRFDAKSEPVSSFSKETEVRAVIESQFLAKRLHAERLGLSISLHNSRILATGGASSSKCILQVLADVFNLPVYVLNIPNSAALGSAYRARHGWYGPEQVSFKETLKGAPEFICVASPVKESNAVYNDMMLRYKFLEENFIRTSR